MEKYDRAGQIADDNIILRMRFACWISKVGKTHRIISTYWYSTANMVTRTGLYAALYVHCVSYYKLGDTTVVTALRLAQLKLTTII